MSNINAVINSNNIQVFPSVNSRDNGKLLLEENLSDIVTKITKLNYIYDYPENLEMKLSINERVSFYLEGKDNDRRIKCNINGYSIAFDNFPSINIYFKDNEKDIELYNSDNQLQKLLIDPNDLSSFSKDNSWSNEYLKQFDNYNYEYPVGIVLSRMANTDRLKGDKIYNNEYYYYGVEVKAGTELIDSPGRDRLILGYIYFENNTSSVSENIQSVVINKNIFFIIDGSTVIINNTDLPNYIKGNYVSKNGNNYNDKGEVIHDSDIYGSLMFRDSKNSESYNIMIGSNEVLSESYNSYTNSINLKNKLNEDSYIDGIKLLTQYTKYKSGYSMSYNYIELNSDILLAEISSDQEDPDNNKYNYFIITNSDNSNDSKCITKISTDITLVDPSSNGVTIIDPYNIFNSQHFIMDKEVSSFMYRFNYDNDVEESCIEFRCNEKLARLSFGEYEVSPILIDYDLKNKDLSINDKLGSLGVVKFCDGQCVDNNSYYQSNDHSLDLPYNYNGVIPSTYSTEKTGTTSMYIPTVLNYADDSSEYKNLSYNSDSLNKKVFDSINKFIIYTGNSKNNVYNSNILDQEEILYGFYVSKDWETDKYFKASAGAYDANADESGNIVSFSEKSGYEYADFPIDVVDPINSEGNFSITTRKSYDYITRRYKVPSNLYGNKILLGQYATLLDTIVYANSDSQYDYDESFNNLIDRNKLNAYFCTDRSDDDSPDTEVRFGFNGKKAPTIEDEVCKYTIVKTTTQSGEEVSILNCDNLREENCIINIPSFDSSKNLYFVISMPLLSTVGAKSITCETISQDGVNYKNIVLYNYDNFKTPDMNISGGNWGIRGFNGGVYGIDFYLNPSKHIITKDVIDDKNNIDVIIQQNGLYSVLMTYGFKINYTYTTSKSYKSYRIHGYFDGCKITQDSSNETIPSESSVGYGSNYEYQYHCYRLIYEVGFENSDIVIDKIKNILVDNRISNTLYKLYRKDGNNIIFGTCTPWFKNNINSYAYPGESKYFYIDNLQKPSVFFFSNNSYEDDANVITEPKLSDNISNNPSSSTFYTRQTGNLGKFVYKDYSLGDDDPKENVIWFIRNFNVIHGTGINFNIGQNKLRVNIDSYLNEVTYANKIVFGEDDEFASVIESNRIRLYYEQDDSSSPTIILFDKDGITFEKDPNDSNDKSINVSKYYDESSNGIKIKGDLSVDRVFNAVYNDYADNLKCSNVSDYEPGDIICKDPHSDEYVISNYDLRNLVIGVYSDTYGHLLGGDKDKSIKENSKKYVPVALAGNVRVKVKGIVNAGDLIEVSNIPGVGQSAKNPVIGTIIGKALESKDSTGVERILMQVMLM